MKEIKEQLEDYQEPNYTIQDLKNLEIQNLLKNSLLNEISGLIDVLKLPDNGSTDVLKDLKIQIDSFSIKFRPCRYSRNC